MKSKLRIAFITSEDPNDKKAWSGTFYQIYNALKKEFDTVDAIYYNSKLGKILGAVNKLTVPLINKKYNHHNSIFRSFIQSKGIERQLKNKDYDLLFCCAASTEIAYLNTDIPIFYFSDTSFGQFANYYDVVKNLFAFSIKESNAIERKALEKAKHIIYPTQWAKDFTNQHYNIPKEKISTVHLGANLDENLIDYTPKNVEHEKTFQILFLGVFWERKGGDIVLETFEKLLENDYNVHLTICGSIPPREVSNTTVIPFLDKNNDNDLQQLILLLKQTDLLFVPTRAECYGIVFNEAASFGIPTLSTHTGGVPEIIENGFNGYLLNLEDDSNLYYEKIITLIHNSKLFSSLSINAREKYLAETNWNEFGKRIREFIELYN